MTKKIFLFFILITFLSCGNENDDIYKTKSGEFASKSGKFIAKFPTKPGYSIIDNQLGLEKFQIHLYISTLGPNKIFSIEYYDYPEYLLQSMTDEQFYKQAVINYSNKMAKSFDLDFQEPIKQHELNGQYFVLVQKQNNKKIKEYIEGKIFRKENRIYTITYIGKNDSHTDSFMNSFRLIK